jgi:hypothetical protein
MKKRNQSPKSPEPQSAESGITFSLQHTDGREWARVDFDATTSRRLEAAAAQTDRPIDQIFRDAIESKLGHVAISAPLARK